MLWVEPPTHYLVIVSFWGMLQGQGFIFIFITFQCYSFSLDVGCHHWFFKEANIHRWLLPTVRETRKIETEDQLPVYRKTCKAGRYSNRLMNTYSSFGNRKEGPEYPLGIGQRGLSQKPSWKEVTPEHIFCDPGTVREYIHYTSQFCVSSRFDKHYLFYIYSFFSIQVIVKCHKGQERGQSPLAFHYQALQGHSDLLIISFIIIRC